MKKSEPSPPPLISRVLQNGMVSVVTGHRPSPGREHSRGEPSPWLPPPGNGSGPREPTFKGLNHTIIFHHYFACGQKCNKLDVCERSCSYGRGSPLWSRGSRSRGGPWKHMPCLALPCFALPSLLFSSLLFSSLAGWWKTAPSSRLMVTR